MIPSSYRNFNLFKQHLGRRERYDRQRPQYVFLFVGVPERVATYSSCSVHSSLVHLVIIKRF